MKKFAKLRRFSKNIRFSFQNLGGGQNFERLNVEKPMLKVTRGPIIRFFYLRNDFFLKLFEHLNIVFFS